MRRLLLSLGSTFLLVASPLSLANQLYLEGGLGNAEAEAGSLDVDDTYIRIGGAMDLMEQVRAEAGYWDFGSSRDDGVRVAADALYGALKGSTDIGNGINLYGRLGLLRWDADVGPWDDDGFDLIFGGGVDFEVGPGRLGVELHFTDLDEVDIRTLGVSYSLPVEF